MEISIPSKVQIVLSALRARGYEAYIVGGCVRDSILGREPEDWDITTSASPGEIKKCFSKTVDTGIQHGTVTVIAGGEGFEVTTYRIDGDYRDGRHPSSVTFTSSLAEDLRRRDFTINAMAYSPESGLVDLFGGQEDLKNGVIRAVGDPEERFGEDALRMMRAVRFAAQLGYSIDEGTREAIRKLSGSLSRISAERIRVELVKTLLSDHPGMLRDMVRLGMTAVFLPELDRCMETPQHNPHHAYSVGEHIIRSVEASEADSTVRLAMLLHDIAKPLCRTTDEAGIDHFKGHAEMGAQLAGQILRRLRFDNDTRDRVVRLVRWHDLRPEETQRAVRHAAVRISPELFGRWILVKRADTLAQSLYLRDAKLSQIDTWERLYQEISFAGQALSLKDLSVTGRDLIEAGKKPGKELGDLLALLLEDVLDHPEHNTREYLLARALSPAPEQNIQTPQDKR